MHLTTLVTSESFSTQPAHPAPCPALPAYKTCTLTLRYLLNYVDHASKWFACMPLKRKHSRAISYALMQIFTSLPGGAPAILHCDNAREFRHLADRGNRTMEPPQDDGQEPGDTDS